MQTRPLSRPALPALIALLALAALAGCASFPPASFPGTKPTGTPSPAPANARERTAAGLDDAARRASRAEQPALQLQAARAWLEAGRTAEATRALHGITGNLTAAQLTERRVLEADIDLANGQAQRAWQKMGAIAEPTGTPMAPQYLDSRTRIAIAAGRPVDGIRAEMAAEHLTANASDRKALRAQLLALLRDARMRGVKL